MVSEQQSSSYLQNSVHWAKLPSHEQKKILTHKFMAPAANLQGKGRPQKNEIIWNQSGNHGQIMFTSLDHI